MRIADNYSESRGKLAMTWHQDSSPPRNPGPSRKDLRRKWTNYCRRSALVRAADHDPLAVERIVISYRVIVGTAEQLPRHRSCQAPAWGWLNAYRRFAWRSARWDCQGCTYAWGGVVIAGHSCSRAATRGCCFSETDPTVNVRPCCSCHVLWDILVNYWLCHSFLGSDPRENRQ